MIRLFFDRTTRSIEGKVTLIYNGVPLFEKLPARSGQVGYTTTEWVKGKSPIPYGKHTLWLYPKQVGQLTPQGKEIGQFYPISSSLKSSRLLTNGKNERWDIGLHPENAFAGSAGCIVLLVNTPERLKTVKALFNCLDQLAREQDYIDIEVL
jgi:hypothetical protein